MNWKKYLPIIGIALFIYILIKIDIKKIILEISKINLFFILIASIVLIFMIIVQTSKWYVIAIKQGINVPFGEALKINLISNFYGFVTPSKLGSAMRIDYLKKYGKNGFGKALCNFTLDKILDISSIFFMAILFAFLLRGKIQLPISLFIGIFLIFFLVTLIFVDKKRSRFLLNFIYRRFIPNKIKNKARITFNSFYDKMPKKRFFILFFFLNLMNWVNVYFITYLVALSLGINLPFIYFLVILPIGTIVSMLPISVNGLGTREAVLISLFSLFGISATKVFSFSLLTMIITGIFPGLLALIFIFDKKRYFRLP